MKLTKKIMSVVIAAIMTVGVLAVHVYAKSIYFTAAELPSGEEQTFDLKSKEQQDYKVVLSQKGTLTINISSELHFAYLYLYDIDGNKIKCSEYDFAIGSGSSSKYADNLHCEWNKFRECFECTVKYELEKGTYFISFYCEPFGNQSGKTSLKATYGPDTVSGGKISYLSLEMEVGDTVRLGAVVSPDNADVTWSSSKSSVAAVSASGKVTAQKKGSAIITAKSGKSKAKIKIIVV